MNRRQRRAVERAERAGVGRAGKAAAISSAAVLASAGAGAAVVLTSEAAHANAVIDVSSLANSGPGTLRQAILDANATPGQDRIEFSVTGTITLGSNLPNITGGVEIVGPGPGSLTVDGGGTNRTFFVDTVTSGSVLIEGLSVTHSVRSGLTFYHSTVPITMRDLVVTDNNSVSNGAGIELYHDSTTILLDGVTITGNAALNSGGGLYACTHEPGMTLTIVDSRIANNHAADGGGGLLVSSADAVTIRNTEISDNTANYGGGVSIRFSDDVTIDGSTMSGNAGVNGGGILLTHAPVSITASTFSGNSATHLGGGIGAIGYVNVDVVASTIANNPGVYYGGGLAGYDNVVVTLENSTVSSNSSRDGGAIALGTSTSLVMTQSTVTGNQATTGPSPVGGVVMEGGAAPGSVGGLGSHGATVDQGTTPWGIAKAPTDARVHGQTATFGTASLTGTIVAGNGGADLAALSSILPVAATHALIGTTTYGVVVTDLGGSRVGVTAEQLALGPLADNGGPTLTHALLPGSVAIDAASATVPLFPGNQWDQRGPGHARVENGLADVGAFEVQVPEPEPNFTG